MWLRDLLPKDLPSIRSIIYGYDTTLLMSDSFQTVDDIALSLTVKLRIIDRSSPSAKPSIFLAHSLGGIVLKRALVLLANSGDTERKVLESIRGIMFFGVPSRGMHVSFSANGRRVSKRISDKAFVARFELSLRP